VNPCAKFGADRPSNVAAYKEHTHTHTYKTLAVKRGKKRIMKLTVCKVWKLGYASAILFCGHVNDVTFGTAMKRIPRPAIAVLAVPNVTIRLLKASVPTLCSLLRDTNVCRWNVVETVCC